MTGDGAQWVASRGLSLAPTSLVALEEALTPEAVMAVAEIDRDVFAVLHEDLNEDASFVLVRVEAFDPVSWTELARHEWWAEEDDCCSGALAAQLDARRAELHVHEPGAVIRPALALPCRNGIEVLYLTPAGVAVTTQLFEYADHPDEDSERWETFIEAVEWLTLEI